MSGEYVCEHVPISAQSAVMVLRSPAPSGSVLVECPCCHLQWYDGADWSVEPMVCPYCHIDAERVVGGAA